MPGISPPTHPPGSSSPCLPGPVPSTSRSTASPPSEKPEKRRAMFSVLFEVQPKADQWDDYLGYAKLLRPELERGEGVRGQHPIPEPLPRRLDLVALELGR